MDSEETNCKHTLRLIEKYQMHGNVLRLIVECRICKQKFEGILFQK